MVLDEGKGRKVVERKLHAKGRNFRISFVLLHTQQRGEHVSIGVTQRLLLLAAAAAFANGSGFRVIHLLLSVGLSLRGPSITLWKKKRAGPFFEFCSRPKQQQQLQMCQFGDEGRWLRTIKGRGERKRKTSCSVLILRRCIYSL